MKRVPGNIIILNLCPTNDNHMMYGSWDTEHDRQNFLSFWAIFLPFQHPPYQPGKLKFWTNEKNQLKISFHTYVYHEWKSYDYNSWDMKRGRQNFLSFWATFCPFTTLTTSKIKILKKIKKLPGDIIILHLCTTNDNKMHVPEILSTTGKIFCHFVHFLPCQPPNNPEN